MTPRTPQAESNKLFFAANSRISWALFQLAAPAETMVEGLHKWRQTTPLATPRIHSSLLIAS